MKRTRQPHLRFSVWIPQILKQAIVLGLISQIPSLAGEEEWTPYKKVLTQKAIGYCLVQEGIMTLKDARYYDNTALRNKGGLTQIQIDTISFSIEQSGDSFVKRNGGCKNLLDGYGRIVLIQKTILPD